MEYVLSEFIRNEFTSNLNSRVATGIDKPVNRNKQFFTAKMWVHNMHFKELTKSIFSGTLAQR